MIRGNDLQPRSSAMEIPAPVVSTILNPGSNINTHYPGKLLNIGDVYILVLTFTIYRPDRIAP